MTYKEAYRKCRDIGELIGKVKHDTEVAMILGGNKDRIKAIEDAMNCVIEEKGWQRKDG